MKACTSCGTKNEERSLFCNECGERLGAGAGSDTGTAQADDPRTASMHGDLPSNLKDLAGVRPGAATPVAPSRAPTVAGRCSVCGYDLPKRKGLSWCPGCGTNLAPEEGDDPEIVLEPEVAETAAPPSSDTVPPRPVADTVPPVGKSVPTGWALVQVRAGERLDRYTLHKPEIAIGRNDGDYKFADDSLLSPLHARVMYRGRRFWVEDAGSRNGVYVRIEEPTALRDGDVLNFGNLVMRYRASSRTVRGAIVTGDVSVKAFGSGREAPRGHLVRILADGSDGPEYPLVPSKTIMGRKIGHILFPDDRLLSRQHVQFFERDGEMMAEDLGSSNGTLLRIREPFPLEAGSVFRVGDVTMEVSRT
ncbi:MAG: FHA domain-containing protein [Planctomycetota bacterium]|jgi:pSer/pThr/pTyr-binding forkhead associated (FHA) protein/RNA polymerase subunit RPABC4/transcription elongation factor Spt4